MKNKLLILLTVLLLTVSSLFSQQQNTMPAVRFDMILTGDPVLEDIRFLSLESGIPFLSFSPPLAPGEVKNFLDSIDESALSPPAKEAYNRALERLSPEAAPLSVSRNGFYASINLYSTVEGRVRFNENVSWQPQQPKIEPFLTFPIQFAFFESLQLYIEPSIKIRPNRYGEGIYDTNIPYDSFHFEGQYWPVRSFASAGGSWWNFHIGRDHLSWGTARTGSLVFSNDAPFYDFARLSFFTPDFKYSFIVNHLPLKAKGLIGEIPDQFDSPDYLDSMNRYFYLHRFDVTFFNKFSIGIMEGIMVGNSPLELRYLNPMIIFHSMYSWRDYKKWEPGNGDGYMIGAFLSIEVNYNIIKPLAVYGQFVMNQFALRSELKKADQPPNGLGYLAGISFTHSFNNWGSNYFLEFIYTDPYLYILNTPFASFIHQDYHYYLLGHSRDTISVTAGTEFFNNNRTLSCKASFSWIASGERNNNGLMWDWELSQQARDARTPSGTAQNQFILSLGAEWKPLSLLTLKADVKGILSHNNNHNSGNIEPGGQAALSVSFKY